MLWGAMLRAEVDWFMGVLMGFQGLGSRTCKAKEGRKL